MHTLDAKTLALSKSIEHALVELNPRGMASLRSQLKPGYCARAALRLWNNRQGKILIGTGFPVANTFETDGPAGAMALYTALSQLGAEVWIAGPPSLAAVLADTHRVIALDAAVNPTQADLCHSFIERIAPDLMISIEVPGAAEDGCYYNIRGVDISAQVRNFEEFMRQGNCPIIGIGDGGNEAGMGNIDAFAAALPIRPAVSRCDELVVADVSNWGGYALVAMLQYWSGEPFLEDLLETPLLAWLVEHGAVDGVTHQTRPTEDGLNEGSGNQIITRLLKDVNTARKAL